MKLIGVSWWCRNHGWFAFVLWCGVLFIVFWIFCIMSFDDCTHLQHQETTKLMHLLCLLRTCYGGFPLLHNFYIHAHACNFTCVNKIETRFDLFCLNMKLSKVQLLLLCAIFHTLPLLFANLNFKHIHTSKLRDRGNQPLGWNSDRWRGLEMLT